MKPTIPSAHWRPPLVTAAAMTLLALAAPANHGDSRLATPAATAIPASGEKGGKMTQPEGWKEIEHLIKEQKFEAAAAAVDAIRVAAQARGDEAEWTRALVAQTQLRIGLHGYETAVRFLKETPWPQGSIHRAVLDLFYGHALTTYLQAYSWEIGQREKVETRGQLDLKAWTREQIFAEAQHAFVEVWAMREKLDGEPISRLADYLEPNTYPTEVRGTLCDAVSYLFVASLADTTNWRPEQESDVFALDLAALLKGDPTAAAVVNLDDASVHPLVKLGAVLTDLEAWHARRGENAAALEARLERTRCLFRSFTQTDDRTAIRADLAQRLPAFRAVSWWAEGMAQLAELTRRDEAPEALVHAHAIAGQGLAAYPDSPGGKHCRTIVAQIEAPNYSLQAMTSDAPGRRSIEVTHANLPALYFRAYAADLLKRLETARDYNLFPNGDEVRTLVYTEKAVAAWKVDLPPTPDYRTHRTFVTPPLSGRGFYIVACSARQDFAATNNRLLSVPMLLGDLVLVARQDEGGVEARVLMGNSGASVAGARVDLYAYDWQHGHHVVDTATTGEDGLVRFGGRAGRANVYYFLLARHDNDLAIDPQYFWLNPQTTPGETMASLVFTDRSIYRPLQKLYWKVLVYHGTADRTHFNTLPETPVKVSLVDPNRQKVDSRTLTTNEFGTASGEFVIPAGRLLGEWQIETSLGGSTVVRVEEYKRPTFEANFEDPTQALRLNREAKLAGKATYYFGLPVTSGRVAWRVSREPVYPWWWGWWGMPRAQGRVIASGAATLDENGGFAVTFVARADERLAKTSKDVSYRYSVTADVTDEGGETRSATRSFCLGFVAVEARFELANSFFRADAPAEVIVVRTNLDGVARAGEGTWRLAELQQPLRTLLPAEEPVRSAPTGEEKPYRTEGDLLRARWDTRADAMEMLRTWPEGAERAHGTATHGANGDAKLDLGKLTAGAYRLTYRTTDEFGAVCEAAKEFVVASPGTKLAVAAMLQAEASSVPVGGTARLLTLSGLPEQQMFLTIFRAGEVVERRELVAGRDSALIEIPVKEEDRGGFGVTLALLSDHQFIELSQQVFVPWDERKLELSFATFRDRLRPGAKETWRILVKGASGTGSEAGAAELLAYMYDRSLDTFAPHNPPTPLSLYPNRSAVRTDRASLGSNSGQWFEGADFVSPPEWGGPLGDRLKFLEGYGIGGPGRRGRMMPMDAARPGAPTAMAKSSFAEEIVVGGVPGGVAAGIVAETEPRAATQAVAAPAPPTPPPALRSDFAETAFWQPHLLTGPDGTAAIEFTVPDSVTSWNVWVHAVTRDLKAGSLHQETRSVKDLMVRPYLPRFLREGDQAEVRVVINDAAEKPLSGIVAFDILDSDTNQSLLADFGLSPAAATKPFAVKAGGGANLTFALTAPKRVGTVAFKVVATASDLSDGELRPLPLLPGRVHLAQSRFVTLHNADTRVMRFDDLARGDDPTRVNEQMVVTVDAQLFYSVLQALPFLVNYPYECTEQTLNRFISTGIVSTLYDRYPAVARMAQEFSKRETRLETFDAADPNRRMALEETPWLIEAKGGEESSSGLVNVLDPRIAVANRSSALAKLAKAQSANGAFPWWPGGPPSPYMTLYIMHGLARAAEFGVDVPKQMVQRGWAYLASHYRDDLKRMMAEDCCCEYLTFLNYVATCYPDPSWMGDALTEAEREEILAFSFKHWQQHSPLLKGFLALTLKRMGRPADASLVWDSVMDSAKTTQDEGTFWAPEDRSWLWYNDTIETHAFALRTLMELSPQDARRDGLVQWLLLNKKLNQWKSTRATAEVIYSLVKYLQAEGALGIPEDATVTVGHEKVSFTFDPARYTGKKSQVVIPGDKVGPEEATVTVEKSSNGFAFASATWMFSTEKLPEQGAGDFFSVSRHYFKREATPQGFVLKPLAEGTPLAVGDEVEVQLELRSKHAAEYVHLRDPRAAGLEPENAVSRFRWDLGIGWYEEVRDSGSNFFFEQLPVGEYTFKYRLRANLAGTFKVAPATVQSMYAPEFNAYSAGATIAIAAATNS